VVSDQSSVHQAAAMDEPGLMNKQLTTVH